MQNIQRLVYDEYLWIFTEIYDTKKNTYLINVINFNFNFQFRTVNVTIKIN